MTDSDPVTLTAYSLQERQRLWEEAEQKAQEKGTTALQEWNAAFIERRKKDMGPNPTQEKARNLYELWVTGCGSLYHNKNNFDQLDTYDKGRWVMLAKSLGNKIDQLGFVPSVPRDVEKYGESTYSPDWADFDQLSHPEDDLSIKTDLSIIKTSYSPQAHQDDDGYLQWVVENLPLRKRWWQFWLPESIDLSYESYRKTLQR